MQVLYQRCAGMDVHQRFVVVCLIIFEAGRRRKEIRTFRTETADLLALRAWLLQEGCTHVGMESTGVYWMPIYRRLEGFARADCCQRPAYFHALSDQYCDDAWLMELITDLQEASPEFRAWWPRHDIRLTCNGSGEINHPLVGRLALQQTILAVPERPDWGMVVSTPLTKVDTVAKLRALMTGRNHSSLRG